MDNRRADITDRKVISLAGSRRTAAFLAQSTARGFRIHRAFDGRTGAGVERFDVAGFQKRYSRTAKGGEIGCAISHFEVLAHFAESSGKPTDVMIVAEDDAILPPEFSEVVERITERVTFDVVLLAHPCEDFGPVPWASPVREWMPLSIFARWVGPVKQPWKYRVGKSPGTMAGAGLYLVTRHAAHKLTQYAKEQSRISWVADDYQAWHQASGLTELYVLRPNLCGWLGGSEIDEHREHFAFLEFSDDRADKTRLERLRFRFGRKSWIHRYRVLRGTIRATLYRK